MMLSLFDRHGRFQEQLSAYIDEELDAAAVTRLERHLAECGSCHDELDELRATVSALRDLPEVEAPRSFALRPEQLHQRKPALGSAPRALALGARVAAAGVAAALAVVLVVDAGDFGGGGVSERATAPQSEPGIEDAGEMFAPSTVGETGDAADGEERQPSRLGADAVSDAGGEATGGPEAPGDGAEEPATRTEAGGGFDALTAAEIGLAAALAMLVAASVALTVRARRR